MVATRASRGCPLGWSSSAAYAHEGFSGMNGRTDAAEYFYQSDFQTVLSFVQSVERDLRLRRRRVVRRRPMDRQPVELRRGAWRPVGRVEQQRRLLNDTKPKVRGPTFDRR
jgi:hypothetical protein